MLRVLIFVYALTALVSLPASQTAFAQDLIAGEQSQTEEAAKPGEQEKQAASPRLRSKRPTKNQVSPFINDRMVNLVLMRQGKRLRDSEKNVPIETLREQLENAATQLDFALPVVEPDPAIPRIQASYQSSLIMANLYDCGRCDKDHVGSAGAVVLSADGLILTNHHVIDTPNEEFNYFGMSHDGRVFPVIEIVAVNKQADLAIVRVDADNLTPVKIAENLPRPMDKLYVISHPHDRYYATTTGVVSRYSSKVESDGDGQLQNWMEITAPFSQGSSGSGVFNRAGELIGLVSRKDAIFSRVKDGTKGLSHIIYKTVPLSEIKKAIGTAEPTE